MKFCSQKPKDSNSGGFGFFLIGSDGVHPKLSRVGGDTNPGGALWAVSSPPTIHQAMRQFGMHPSDVFIFYGVYKQIITGHPFGQKPAGNTELLIISGITLMLTILFLIIRLDTQIKKDGVYVKFFPLHLRFRHYSWTQLSKFYVRKYSPMAEYGGWGLRFGFGGKAYNISGNQGLQLEFKNKKTLLIGTQRSEQLNEVIQKIETQ